MSGKRALFSQYRFDQRPAQARLDRDAHRARHPAPVLRHPALDAQAVGEQGFGARQQFQPGGGQRGTPSRALEQPNPEFGFELRDGLAHSGLRRHCQRGGAGEAAGGGNVQEQLEITKFHGRPDQQFANS